MIGKLFTRLEDYASAYSKEPYARRVEYCHGRRKITANSGIPWVHPLIWYDRLAK